MNKLARAADERAERRAQIEPLIAAYPDLPDEDMHRLLTWYRAEASSHDIAMLSMNAEIADGYARFRAGHIDRMTWRDYLKFLAFMGAIFGTLVVLIWMGMG